jgi:hypothetical protein
MFSFIFYFLIITSLVSTSSTSGNSESRCVPLRRCESVQWLITNLARLSFERRSTVVRQINRMQCGINDQSEMLILCPKTISDSVIENQEERLVFGSRNSWSECAGSVKVKLFSFFYQKFAFSKINTFIWFKIVNSPHES